jgi:WD40 repeat protein
LVDLEGNGHTEMISAMIMMPKLQFLATGGYDGKLILWDTISQTKKFNYTGHTRSISSMTFHEGLILLFSAAYDHSICVWNPYIQSLIHKIINNVNFIQLGIIPDTNLLIALDSCSNVKIR